METIKDRMVVLKRKKKRKLLRKQEYKVNAEPKSGGLRVFQNRFKICGVGSWDLMSK